MWKGHGFPAKMIYTWWAFNIHVSLQEGIIWTALKSIEIHGKHEMKPWKLALASGYNLVHDVFRCLWPGVYSGLQTTGLESQSSVGWIHTSVAKQMVAATAKQLGFQEKQKHKWWSWFLGIFPASNSLEISLLSVLVGHRSLFGCLGLFRPIGLYICAPVFWAIS